MKRALALASLALALGIGTQVSLAGSDVTKPYYSLGAGQTLSPLEQQRLSAYRDQLETQQRAQQLQLYQGSLATSGYNANGVAIPNSMGPLRPLTNPAASSSNLYRTQTELNRVNGILNRSRTNQMLALPPAMVVKRFPVP
jgi:hypothetical protein